MVVVIFVKDRVKTLTAEANALRDSKNVNSAQRCYYQAVGYAISYSIPVISFARRCGGGEGSASS